MLVYRGKISIYIQPFFWVTAVIIGWLNSFSIPGMLVWVGVILISVLIHEFGHALTARQFGHSAKIELFAFGGLTHRYGPPLKLWKEFLIVFNGPLAGLMLFLLALQLRLMLGKPPQSLLTYAIDVTMYVNLFWTIVNLLPVYPLDGGHLMRIVLEGMFGLRGVKVALFSSIVIAGAISVLFFTLGQILLGALFFLLMFESYKSWKEALTLKSFDRNQEVQTRFKEAQAEMRHGNTDYALQQFLKLREDTKEGIIFTSATEHASEILTEQERLMDAYTLLAPLGKVVSPDGLRLLHQLAYRTGHWDEAISIGNRAFQNFPSYDTALVNALCHSILGQAKPALGWLQTAVDEGLPNLADVLKQREFDLIRDLPEFRHFQEETGNGT